MFEIPEWTFEFHGHRCPFMPLGYRMATVALQKLGVGRSKNHEMHIFSEMGIGHPQGCLQDGMQCATSATFGKGMIEKLFYGKVAATFFYPGKGAVRLILKADFADKMAPHEFFRLRKQGVAPSEISADVADDIIKMVLTATDEEMFDVRVLPDFQYRPIKASFNKAKCEICGEYVFERYLRQKDGKITCLLCSGYGKDAL